MNANVIGKINYLLPLYLNACKDQIKKIHKVVMSAARGAIGNYCFMKTNTYILKKCGWFSINKMIQFSAIKLINKILINKEPNSIFNYFKINRRSIVDIVTTYKPKTKKTENFYIYSALKMFNSLPRTKLKLPKISKVNLDYTCKDVK